MEVSWETLWRVLTVIILALAAFLTLDVLLAIFLALVISAGLDAPVSWLERRGLPRILGTLGIFLLAILVVAILVYTIVPLALTEFTQLLLGAKEFTTPLFGFFKTSDVITKIEGNLSQLTDALLAGSASFVGLAADFFGGVFLVISTLVLAFYLTVGRDGVEKFLMAVVPADYEDYVLDVYERTRHKIGRWLKGQMILSLGVGTGVFFGLLLLGVKYPLLLAVLSAIFEIVPFVGPIFSGATAVLVALSTSLILGFYTFILFIFIQQVENNLFVPAVMKFTTSLNPAVVLISILLGGKLFGFVGLIIAVPLAVLIQEIVDDWVQTKRRRKGLAL